MTLYDYNTINISSQKEKEREKSKSADNGWNSKAKAAAGSSRHKFQFHSILPILSLFSIFLIQYCHYSRAAAATGAIFCGRNLDLQKIERGKQTRKREMPDQKRKAKAKVGRGSPTLS